MNAQQDTTTKKDIEFLKRVHANITDFKAIYKYNCPSLEEWKIISKKLNDKADRIIKAYEKGLISEWECFCEIIKAE